MRIIFITTEFYPMITGTANATLSLCRELVKRGYEIEVVTLRGGNSKKFEIFENIRVYRLDCPNLRILRGIIFIIKAIIKSIRMKNGVLYSQMIYPSGLITAAAGKLSGKTSITHARGFDVNEILMQGNYLKRGLSLFSLKHNNFVFSLSEDHKDKMEQYCKRKIFVVPNGIEEIELKEPRNECRDILGFNNKYFHVIYVGRLMEWKGVIYLLDAIKDLKNSRVHVIGDGPEEKNLKEFVAENRLKNVIFYGELPREEVFKFMKAADCFVHPELRGQGLGNVVLEAMYFKLPVIGMNVGYFPELIKDGKTGLLAEPANSDSIKKAILKLKDNPILRDELSKNAFDMVAEEYNWEGIVGRIEKILQESGVN